MIEEKEIKEICSDLADKGYKVKLHPDKTEITYEKPSEMDGWEPASAINLEGKEAASAYSGIDNIKEKYPSLTYQESAIYFFYRLTSLG